MTHITQKCLIDIPILTEKQKNFSFSVAFSHYLSLNFFKVLIHRATLLLAYLKVM